MILFCIDWIAVYLNLVKMTSFIAIILFLIFLFLSSIHVYWSLGGRWGSGAVIPTKDDHVKLIMPGVVPTLIVAFGLLGFGFFILTQAGILSVQLPQPLNRFGLWVIAGIFILRAMGDFNYVGFFKKIKQTKFGKNDTRYYSPLCLLIGLLTIFIELNK